MNKKTTVLLILLIVLSIFTYIKLDELKKIKEYSKLLLVEIENNKIEFKEINFKLEEKENENEMIKLQHKMESETRNVIDIKARRIYDAFIHREIEYLKNEVSSDVKVENEKITFENGYVYKLDERNDDFVLRQRYYFLNEDRTTFVTGYEILMENVEFVPVYNFEFINENGDWKLNNIYEE